MKKRLLIICSIIGVLLAGFQFPIYAETTPPDYSSSTSIMSSTPLDQYFYDNYELLPYIESNGSQYVNSGINASSNLLIETKFNILDDSGTHYIFGSREDWKVSDLSSFYEINQNSISFVFNNGIYRYSHNFDKFSVVNVKYDKNNVYFNNSLIHTFDESDISSSYPIYIFALNNKNNLAATTESRIKLYNFSIYDYSANDGEGALVRDYYPARSKSGGVLGLYDAVSKTFVTTSGSVPFELPDGDPVNLSLGANITQFLSGSLSWIGAIFEGINEMPIIWVFIAIALAGVGFRWARRIVHF